MSYAIEDGIPVPSARGGRANGSSSPETTLTQTIAKMEPSQSVLFETEDEYRKARKYVERKRDRVYTGRKVPRLGWRLWRTA